MKARVGWNRFNLNDYLLIFGPPTYSANLVLRPGAYASDVFPVAEARVGWNRFNLNEMFGSRQPHLNVRRSLEDFRLAGRLCPAISSAPLQPLV
jgi:hypothetical protein